MSTVSPTNSKTNSSNSESQKQQTSRFNGRTFQFPPNPNYLVLSTIYFPDTCESTRPHRMSLVGPVENPAQEPDKVGLPAYYNLNYQGHQIEQPATSPAAPTPPVAQTESTPSDTNPSIDPQTKP